MATRNRPLSPHVFHYRWGWTMSLSILHRSTGLILSVGTVLAALWLMALAAGPAAFAQAQAYAGHWSGRLVLFGWTLALCYHLCNGIRHLFWDAGKGFELHHARRSGAAVIISTLLLQALIWSVGYGLLGGAA